LASNLSSQSMPYVIDEFPSVFSRLENQLEQEEFDSALTLCTFILNKESDPKIKGIAYFYKGQIVALMNNYSLANTSFQNALEIFERIDFEKGLAMVYCKKGDVYYNQRILLKADTFYNQSIRYAKKLNLYEILIDAFQNKSAIYNNYQDHEAAINALKTALKYAHLKRDQNQSKNILNQISTNYHATGQLDSAIFYFQKGLLLKQEMKDMDGLISDYSALGNLFRERGNYEVAQKNLIAALEIAEAEQDTFSITTIYAEIGDVYAAQMVWNLAEKYYNQALQLAQLKNSRFAEAGCLKNLGKIYYLQNNENTSVEYYEASLKIYEQLNSKINAADVLISLSKVYQEGNQFVKAKALLMEALAARSHSQDKMSTIAIKMALSEIEINHGSLSKGITIVEECLGICQKMKDKDGLRQCYLLLADAYAKSNDFEKAYQYYQQFNIANDSLTSIERTKAINELEMRYETEKKDKEIAQQKVEIEKQRVEIQIRNNQLLMLAGGLALIGLLATLLFFINRKNKQLNQQKIEVLKKEQETQHLKAVIEGEEKERKRVAEELHDGLGAVLATVKMSISSIGHKLPNVQSLQTYQETELLIDDACRTVREISHALMPHVLEQQGLEFAIDDLCQTLSNNNDITFDFIYFGNEQLLSDVIKTSVFRITQELMKNILKHAQAKEVIVQLTIEATALMLVVEDDGKGFDNSKPHKGIGLENIQSRVTYLNGRLDIESEIGRGSTFTIQVPLDQA
jgi:signal transduction histidine kinase